jgi:hypothetical protein
MRRATHTALIAFETHVGDVPIIAHELAHETAGRHTCDRRLSRTALAAAFPAVSYSEVRQSRPGRIGERNRRGNGNIGKCEVPARRRGGAGRGGGGEGAPAPEPHSA